MGAHTADVGIPTLQRRAEDVHRTAVRADGSGIYDGQDGAAVCQGGGSGREAVDGESHSYRVQFERDEGCADAGLTALGGVEIWLLVPSFLPVKLAKVAMPATQLAGHIRLPPGQL